MATSQTTYEDFNSLEIVEQMHYPYIHNAYPSEDLTNIRKGILPFSYPNPNTSNKGDSLQLPRFSKEELREQRKGKPLVKNYHLGKNTSDPRKLCEETIDNIKP